MTRCNCIRGAELQMGVNVFSASGLRTSNIFVRRAHRLMGWPTSKLGRPLPPSRLPKPSLVFASVVVFHEMCVVRTISVGTKRPDGVWACSFSTLHVLVEVWCQHEVRSESWYAKFLKSMGRCDCIRSAELQVGQNVVSQLVKGAQTFFCATRAV